MYLVINGARYSCSKRKATKDTVKYYSVKPEPEEISGTIQMFRDDGFLLSEDNADSYERKTYVGTCLTVTNVPEPVVVEPTIDEVRTTAETWLSEQCNAAIVAGMDVETSVGTEHFSLQETDQINLTTATSAVQNGATAYPYHADGSLCRMFTAEEIMAVAQAATNHKLYHTTLCNHLLTWTRRAETIEEIGSITYSEENLPEDLAANMASIFAATASI